MKFIFFFISIILILASVNCDDPANICNLEPFTGVCRASDPRWYYNAGTKSCLPFVYGGCDGNENNFLTRAACEEKCSGV
ncbi:hypothetical protein ACKWTF_008560 [Chironomus riparius]